MTTLVHHSPQPNSPPGPAVQRPRGILKNSFQKTPSPPISPARERSLSEKEITIANTQFNAGRRSSSSGVRPVGSRRASSRASSQYGDDDRQDPSQDSQRLKWDEVNLYLTEQERSSTMKITEPKTPYATHYDPAEDPSDEDEAMGGMGLDADRISPTNRRRLAGEDDIPAMSLGEPEEAIPESESGKEKQLKAVQVGDRGRDDDGLHDEEELVGLSPEGREKHRRFEEMRKKHYEMKGVAHLLGHPEVLPDDEEADGDDEGAAPPPVPPVPNRPNGGA
ncbi:hypothetical protein SODALDRAFT_329690 [Sodiomyces alkalinus F11]|uniref:Glc8 protein n=1 Tax=Sodiomyces alkalinus (strain CBS 110278 / VKM F-3762 / F11) TaxID=1314773 RepID=A0A3N2PJ66_SODAK|nr:hypothetical protein SODALDRAFT_329690 [Sodiomyces alkalinus F11]ROT34583.1 hypothetical protein SODALDRAFT_329690 [Sodiomyces alkalinus F11]